MARFTEEWLKQRGEKRLEFSIGIDPGKSTGFAVWSSSENRFLVIETVTSGHALKKIRMYPSNESIVTVEVPQTKANFHGGEGSHIQSVNIGMVIGQARLIVDYLKSEGYTVIEMHPQGKLGKDGFRLMTGYSGRTSQHARDAGVMAYKHGR